MLDIAICRICIWYITIENNNKNVLVCTPSVSQFTEKTKFPNPPRGKELWGVIRFEALSGNFPGKLVLSYHVET